jgi:hypothetical protein
MLRCGEVQKNLKKNEKWKMVFENGKTLHDTMERKRDGRFYTKICLKNREKKSPIIAMIDSGATTTVISGNPNSADGTQKQTAVQFDGTNLTLFKAKKKVTLVFGDWEYEGEMFVHNGDSTEVIFGVDWITKCVKNINFKTWTMNMKEDILTKVMKNNNELGA